MDNDKNWSLASSNQIADALKNTMLQLEGLKENNIVNLKNSLQSINDKTKQKIEESAKKLQEKIREEKQRCRTLNTYSDIQDDNAVVDQNMQNYSSQASQTTKFMHHVQFNNLAYNYNILDSVNKPPVCHYCCKT